MLFSNRYMIGVNVLVIVDQQVPKPVGVQCF